MSSIIRSWIVDASPIILLGRAGRIALLESLCPTPIIPKTVAEEIRRGRTQDPAKQWLETYGSSFITLDQPFDSQVTVWDLGAGETAVLSLGLQMPGSKAIVDDRAARNCASILGIDCLGTLGT